MPFDINYGPISTAMGLARQAGQAQGTQLGFQDQQEMQRQLLAQQQASQQARAQDISLSLEGQRNAATQNLAQAQLANTAAYQHANLAQLGAYRQGVVGARQETADTGQLRAQNQGNYQEQSLGLKQQQLQQQSQYQQWEAQNRAAIAQNGQAQQANDFIKIGLANGKSLTDADMQQAYHTIQAELARSGMIQGAMPSFAPQPSETGSMSMMPAGHNPMAGPGYSNYAATPPASGNQAPPPVTDPQQAWAMAQQIAAKVNSIPNLPPQQRIQAVAQLMQQAGIDPNMQTPGSSSAPANPAGPQGDQSTGGQGQTPAPPQFPSLAQPPTYPPNWATTQPWERGYNPFSPANVRQGQLQGQQQGPLTPEQQAQLQRLLGPGFGG